jgi:hypothetical protein
MLNFLPLPNICGHQGVDSSNCVQDAQYASQQWQRIILELQEKKRIPGATIPCAWTTTLHPN